MLKGCSWLMFRDLSVVVLRDCVDEEGILGSGMKNMSPGSLRYLPIPITSVKDQEQ